MNEADLRLAPLLEPNRDSDPFRYRGKFQIDNEIMRMQHIDRHKRNTLLFIWIPFLS